VNLSLPSATRSELVYGRIGLVVFEGWLRPAPGF